MAILGDCLTFFCLLVKYPISHNHFCSGLRTVTTINVTCTGSSHAKTWCGVGWGGSFDATVTGSMITSSYTGMNETCMAWVVPLHDLVRGGVGHDMMWCQLGLSFVTWIHCLMEQLLGARLLNVTGIISLRDYLRLLLIVISPVTTLSSNITYPSEPSRPCGSSLCSHMLSPYRI